MASRFRRNAELKARNVRETRTNSKEKKNSRDKRGSSKEMEAEAIVCAKKRHLQSRVYWKKGTIISRMYTHTHIHTKASIRGESKKSEVEQCKVQNREDYENETRRHVAK